MAVSKLLIRAGNTGLNLVSILKAFEALGSRWSPNFKIRGKQLVFHSVKFYCGIPLVWSIQGVALAAVVRVRQQQGAAYSLTKVSFNCNQAFGLVNLEECCQSLRGT